MPCGLRKLNLGTGHEMDGNQQVESLILVLGSTLLQVRRGRVPGEDVSHSCIRLFLA
jgi:hypothetical protein